MINSTAINVNSTNLSQLGLNFIRSGYYIRVIICPLVEIIGSINNIFILLVVDFFDIIKLNLENQRKNIVNRKTDKNKHLEDLSNSSTNTKDSKTFTKSNSKIELSRSAKVYISSIAFFETAVQLSTAYQRSWIRDVSSVDPTTLSPESCKAYQFIFNIFLLVSSW